MGNYLAGWTVDDQRAVTSVEELDAVLDGYETHRGELPDVPVAILIVDADADDLVLARSLKIGLGRDRAYVYYSGDTAGECGFAVDDSVPDWSGDLAWDSGGAVDRHEPWRTRLTHGRARELAREWVRTGARPTGVTWLRTSQVDAR